MEGPRVQWSPDNIRDYVPTRFLPFAGDVAAYRALDSVRTAEIAVHAIVKSRHVSIKNDVSPMIGHAFCSN